MARKLENPHLRLRIEASLLARLERAAEKNQRTLTGEIAQRLEGSFKRDALDAQASLMAERVKIDLREQLDAQAKMIAEMIRTQRTGGSSMIWIA